MANFFRILIWIFCSFSVCLQANPINDMGFKLLKSSVLCPIDTTFHVPTNETVNCITDGLGCFLMGLDTEECRDDNGYMGLAGDTLCGMIDVRKKAGYPPTNSTNCPCEESRLPYQDFLRRMSDLVEYHFSSTNVVS